jgi:hypothetical protein
MKKKISRGEPPTLPLHLRVVDALGVKSPFSCSTCWRWARSTFPRLPMFVVGIFVIVRRYGVSLGPLVVVRRYASSLVVTGPYSSSLGPLVIVGPSSSSLVTWPVLVVVGGPIRRRRWVVVRAYSSSLECRRALHRVSSSSGCPTLRRWVRVPPCWRHSRGHGWGGLLVSYSMC